jgi:hypothetical protein
MALMELYDKLCAVGIIYARIESPYYRLSWRLDRFQLILHVVTGNIAMPLAVFEA